LPWAFVPFAGASAGILELYGIVHLYGIGALIPPPTSPSRFKTILSGREPQTEFVMSPSQIDKVIECERAAGLVYIDGYREEGQNLYQELGSRIHDILETYVKTGQKPDLSETFELKGEYNGKPWSRIVYPGQIADVAICLVPTGAAAESETIVTRPNGIKWTVKRDLRANVRHAGRIVREVRDYKTTGDLAKADEKHLDTDTQASVYAWAEFTASPGLTEVLLHWQFLRTKGKPDSKSVYFLSTPAHAETQMERLDKVAEKWVTLRRKGAAGELRGADLEPTGLQTGACERGFGCPHRGTRCKVSDTDLLKYALKGQEMGDINAMINELAAKQSAVGNIPAPAAYVPAPAPLSRPSYWIPGDPMNAVQAQLAGLQMPLSVIASRADNPPPAELGATYDKAVQAPVERGFINPPEASPVPAINPQAMAAMVAPALAQPSAPVADEAKARRQALKDECVKRGLVGEDCKFGAERLEKMLAQASQPALPIPAPTPAPVQVATNIQQYEANLDARLAAQGGPYVPPPAPVAVSAPTPTAIPAPATAVQFDDATLDAIAERIFGRICKALTFA
jgi:hypothetical protein